MYLQIRRLLLGFEESKFTYLSNSIGNSLNSNLVLKNQNLHISQTYLYPTTILQRFWRIKIYISLKLNYIVIRKFFCFEESKFTYLSNCKRLWVMTNLVLKNQNLHISQTIYWFKYTCCLFWRIKIYISLKPSTSTRSFNGGFEESKFTYLSNLDEFIWFIYTVLKNQNLHISQTEKLVYLIRISFWRIKIYISLKQ